MKLIQKLSLLCCALLFSITLNAQTAKNLTEIGGLTVGQLGGSLNDIWGYADSLGNEYAIIGIQSGVVFVDVTVPTSPVLLHTITSTSSTWRDIRVYNDFAYVTCEANIGLMIVDLRYIQDSVPYIFTNLGIGFDDAHNISLDEETGFAYLVGGGGGPTNGAVMIDLNPDPWNPVHLGNYNVNYIHDAMVRNDTMYASEIYTGKFAVVDVTNKSAPNVLATQATSLNFTHQSWPSDDNDFLFAVDEKSAAYIDAFDISDLSNIEKVDRIQSNPGSGVIPHNTFYINGYLVTSYYRDGVTIHDASRPHNLCQVGYNDTYTAGGGNGFQGCWGVYPYLPSGNIIASDRNTGLKVLSPTYVRGCYVEGNVTDDCSGIALSGVNVEILTGFTGNIDDTDVTGSYAVATADAGTYDIVFSKAGYISDTITGLVLSNGVLIDLDVTLSDGSDITIPPMVHTDVTCFGGSTGEANCTPLGGTSPYNYDWSNGGTTSSVAGLMAGVYTVVVTDAVGCTATSSVLIEEPSPINITTSKSNVSCDGGTNGSANAVASGGVGGFAYQWNTNPAQTTQSISNLEAGQYTVTITDDNGCPKQSTVSVNVPAAILTFNIPQNPSGGGNDGSINLLVSGGVNPYTYNWSTGATTEDVQNLSAGFYFCQVSDRNGCAEIEAVTLSGPPNIVTDPKDNASVNVLRSSKAPKIYPNPGNGTCTIDLGLDSKTTVLIEVFDLRGQTVNVIEIEESRSLYDITIIPESAAVEGIYMLRISSSERVDTFKYSLYR
ncbi:MAG: choice-of-anchor B family protein [Bacteroidia bacterium]|nr:choice-of-anchor B family protein [Bacteroidia bacterium]